MRILRKINLTLLAVLWSAPSYTESQLLELTETLTPERVHDWPVAAYAAKTSPHVVFIESGGVYWLFDVETKESQLIAESDLFGPDGLSLGIYWGGDSLIVLHSSLDSVKRKLPLKDNAPKIYRAEIDNASLRLSSWIEKHNILISEVDPHVLEESYFKVKENTRRRHLPTQSGLVVLDDNRYVTSGYEDQSLQVWSLPEGEQLHEWMLGRWYSPRRITHIAVVQNRLLVASGGGRIEERSPDTGEVLWSIRPCRGSAATFRYSSQYRHMGKTMWPPLESLNVDHEIHYTCGTQMGTIERVNGEWRHEPLLPRRQLKSPIMSVETLPGGVLAVLVTYDGDVLVLDRDKKQIVQTLEKAPQYNPNPVTYVAATGQLLVVGEQGDVHLYRVTEPPH